MCVLDWGGGGGGGREKERVVSGCRDRDRCIYICRLKMGFFPPPPKSRRLDFDLTYQPLILPAFTFALETRTPPPPPPPFVCVGKEWV